MGVKMTRTFYGMKWRKVHPGRWRSDCGWYEVMKCHHGLWVMTDLSDGPTHSWAPTMKDAVWQLVQRNKT